MVYESGFTTRRTYTTRPIVTSYSVTLPVVTKFSRVYKTSYPIYSTGAYTRGSRVITSPVRVVTSPARIITRVTRSPSPPIRVIRTTRVITSPERISSYSYTTPTYSYSSSPYLSTSSYLPSTYLSTYTIPTSTYLPSYTYTPISRLYTRSLSPVRVTTTPLRVTTPSYLKRTTLPGYGARALTKYLGTEPFTTFKEETDRIRHRAQSLIRDVHTPVIRQSRSTTPFPAVLGWEPYDKLALDAYVARVTNPVRHVAKEVHRMSMYAEPARKYVGKSHLASVRICGNRSYDIRKPMYDTDRIHTDINLLSWYMRHPTKKQEKNIEVNEKKVESVETDPDLDPHRPSRKFSAPRSLEDPEEDVEMKEKKRLRQERLMTVAEEAINEVDLAKKKTQRLDEKKRREQKAVEDEAKRKADEVAAKKRAEQERTAKEAAQKAKEIARREEEARLRKEEEEKAVKAAEEAERKAKEEAEKRQAEEEERKRLLEEEAKKAVEEARLAEETKKAEEAARLAAEEIARKAAEAARLAEEQRIREEELQRLAEIEKQAEEEKEAELARQAAELAELARQESEIAAQELQAMQQQSEEKENIETGEPEKNLANEQPAAEPIIEEPLSPISPEIDMIAPPSQEPNIEMNIDGGDAADWDDLENASYDNSEDDYDN